MFVLRLPQTTLKHLKSTRKAVKSQSTLLQGLLLSSHLFTPSGVEKLILFHHTNYPLFLKETHQIPFYKWWQMSQWSLHLFLRANRPVIHHRSSILGWMWDVNVSTTQRESPFRSMKLKSASFGEQYGRASTVTDGQMMDTDLKAGLQMTG